MLKTHQQHHLLNVHIRTDVFNWICLIDSVEDAVCYFIQTESIFALKRYLNVYIRYVVF